MRRMHARETFAIIVGLIVAATCARVARGEENAAAVRIEAVANFLAKAQHIGVVVDCTYDVVQDSGQKIEFGERRELTLRRPDRTRVDVTWRDGSRRGIRFDGTQLTTFDLDRKVYATVERPGTVDAALDYYTEQLKMRLPLRELFAADLPQRLKDVLESARLVDKETIGGVATDHIAFRIPRADVQVWVARDGDPLLQRTVLTYRHAEGQPQFTADFHNWTFSPDVPDSAFTFVPQEGAAKIPIVKPGRRPAAGEKRP